MSVIQLPEAKPTMDLDALLSTDTSPSLETEIETEQTNVLKCYGITLPSPVKLSAIWEKPTPLAPEIISGVLRQGHKLILTGPSKAGKSIALMELAMAVATGGKWLGFECKKGPVLYVNLEISENSCFNRLKKIGVAMKLKANDIRNITVWNLRGYTVPFGALAPKISEMVSTYNLALVILDPIYKVFTGSENDQETVTEFCNNLDLMTKAGASVVYCHHHSKGIQGGKDPMDRGSGSGVFARDADAILDLLKIDFDASSRKQIDPEDQTVSAWELTGVLREFAPFEKKQIYYRYPLHEVCTDGRLDEAKPQTSNRKGGNTRGSQRVTEAIANYKRFETAYGKLSADSQPVKIKDIAKEIGMSDKTVRGYATTGGFVISKGKISKEEKEETR